MAGGIRTDGSPSYFCYLQLATGSSTRHPEVQIISTTSAGFGGVSSMTTGNFRATPPAWSLPSSGVPVTVGGTLGTGDALRNSELQRAVAPALIR